MPQDSSDQSAAQAGRLAQPGGNSFYLPVIAAVLSGGMALSGTFLGSRLNAASTRTLQEEKTAIEYRMRVYQDFLLAQSKSSAVRTSTDEVAKRIADEEIRSATVRIAVFSPKAVAVPVAAWLQTFLGEACAQPNEPRYKILLNDLAMYHAMRSEAHLRAESERVSQDEMATLVFGCRMNST